MCTENTEADLDRAGHARGAAELCRACGRRRADATLLPPRAMAGKPVKGRDVTIKTDDGDLRRLFRRAGRGQASGRAGLPDIRGLRPAFRQMADRLAGEGYAVLTVNPFYRWQKSPVVDAANDWGDPGDARKAVRLSRSSSREPIVETDAKAHLAFLDAQKEVDTKRKLGTTGYCMGGPMVIYTAALNPNRVGAAASFHGGGVATDKPDSPHLLIDDTNAGYLFAIADNDDQETPNEKVLLNADPRAAPAMARGRGLRRRDARLVPARWPRLQRSRSRKGMEPDARAVQGRTGLRRNASSIAAPRGDRR